MGNDGTSRWIWIIGAFVAGLLIGWFVFGWLLFPVTYQDVPLSDVRTDNQAVYLQAVAQAYQTDPNQAVAIQRLQLLGTQAEVEELMADVAQQALDRGDVVSANQIYALAAGIGLDAGAPPPAQATPPAPGATPQPATTPAGSSDLLLALLGIAILGAGIALAIWLLTRRKPAPAAQEGEAYPGYQEGEFATYEPVPEQGEEEASAVRQPTSTMVPVAPSYRAGPALQEYTATFVPGDASYDETFSIEAPGGGGYLGECGMTFSEMINGDPNRITALEVWLFDKSDIRTVTKVLMSDYAYGNPALREKLASRGDAILARPGQGFVLDAQTLRLEGEIEGLEYLEGEGPAHSAFRQLTVTMRVGRQAQ